MTVVMFLLFQDVVSMTSTTSRAFVALAMLEGHATLITMTAVLLLVITVLNKLQNHVKFLLHSAINIKRSESI